MTLEFFNAMTEDERSAYLKSCEVLETTSKDQEAEISSLKTENETLKAGSGALEAELKKTKELNFTLARQVDTGAHRPSFEDTLADAFNMKRRE